MPNWKKVITSGSDAILNSLSVGDLGVTGSVEIYRSGSVGDTDVFTIEGGFGTLFSVTDELSGSLFSVNDISGIPIFEVFSDDTVKIGTYNAEGIEVQGSILTLPTTVDYDFADDTAALAGGIPIGGVYHSSGVLKIRLT